MLRTAVVVCLLSVAAARYCCTPEQWEGDMGVIIGSLMNKQTSLIEVGNRRNLIKLPVR